MAVELFCQAAVYILCPKIFITVDLPTKCCEIGEFLQYYMLNYTVIIIFGLKISSRCGAT